MAPPPFACAELALTELRSKTLLAMSILAELWKQRAPPPVVLAALLMKEQLTTVTSAHSARMAPHVSARPFRIENPATVTVLLPRNHNSRPRPAQSTSALPSSEKSESDLSTRTPWPPLGQR